jgi:hypothetical protein
MFCHHACHACTATGHFTLNLLHSTLENIHQDMLFFEETLSVYHNDLTEIKKTLMFLSEKPPLTSSDESLSRYLNTDHLVGIKANKPLNSQVSLGVLNKVNSIPAPPLDSFLQAVVPHQQKFLFNGTIDSHHARILFDTGNTTMAVSTDYIIQNNLKTYKNPSTPSVLVLSTPPVSPPKLLSLLFE